MRFHSSILLLAAVSLLACDRPTGPNDGSERIARVELLPAELRLDWVQDRLLKPFTIRLYTADGDSIPLGDRPVVWQSSNAQVARIDTAGTLEGRNLGTATIEAIIGGVKGSARVDVGALGLGAVTGVRLYPGTQWAAVGDVAHYDYEVLRTRTGFDEPVWTGEPIDSAWSLDPGVVSATTMDRLGLVQVVAGGLGTGRIAVARGGYADTVRIEVRESPPLAPPMGSLTMALRRACGRTIADGRFFCWPMSQEVVPFVTPAGGAFLPFAHDFASLSVSFDFACGLRADGLASCWGANWHGGLGTGDVVARTLPDTVWGGHRFTEISTGGDHTCGLRADSTAMCWGNGKDGSLGTGGFLDAESPVVVQGGHRFLDIASGNGWTCAIRIDRRLLCWGFGLGGQIGDGTSTTRYSPTVVTGLTNVTALSVGVSHSCALTSDGAAYCWGINFHGQLGDGTTSMMRAAPVRVLNAPPLVAIASGSGVTCGRTAAGAVHCWGVATGFAVSSDGTRLLTPTLVPGGHQFVDIAIGDLTVCGRKSDGTTWCWGQNFSGQVGDGTNISRWIPRQVRIAPYSTG